MNPKKLAQLRKRAFSRVPLVGRWLRRKAVDALAQDGSAQAVHVLAQVVTRTADKDLAASIVAQVLPRLAVQPAIDAVCAVWAESRDRRLAGLLTEGGWVAAAPVEIKVLSALHVGRFEAIKEGSPRIAGPLVQACEDADASIAERAQSAIGELVDPDVRQAVADRLCVQWSETRSAVLEGIVVRGRYVAQKPLRVRVLSALKTGQPELIVGLGADAVGPLLEAGADADREISHRGRLALGQLAHQDAREEVCRRVVHEDHPMAREAALQGMYLPRDEYQRALFLFVTEQWDRYETLDFDRRLLRTAYASAEPALRQRLMDKLRAAGRVEFLTVVAGGDYRSRAAVITSGETEFLIQMLADKKEWEKLWSLALEVPAVWSLRILRILSSNGWQPETDDGQDIYGELIPLTVADMVTSGEEIGRYLAPAVQQARVRITGGRINDVAFSPVRPVVAIGTTQRKIVTWDLQRAEREWISDGLSHSIGQVTFTHSDRLVCAERTTDTRARCSVYGRRDGKMVPLWQHSGSVTAIEPVQGSQILTAGRDQAAAVLDVDTGRVVREVHLSFWARAACVAPGGELAALLHSGAALISLPQLDELASTREWKWRGTSRRAAFSPRGEELILGKFSREVIVLARQDRSLVAHDRPFATHDGTIQAVKVLPSRSVVITAASDGLVQFTTWPSRSLVGTVRTHEPQLTSLHTSPDESFMAIGEADGSMSLWDLRVLDVPMLFTVPLAKTVPNHLAAVRVVAGNVELPSRVRSALLFLERILRYRFRFDIEIGEVPQISVGEFDIEIG